MQRIVAGFSLILLLLSASRANSQGCELSQVEISVSVQNGRRDTYVQDTLIALDSTGTMLWSHKGPVQSLNAFQPKRMADAWIESSATDTTVVLFLTNHVLQVFDCTGQPLRNMWFTDRLPQYRWEMSAGHRAANGKTLRVYGADHVGKYLRAFALDVSIPAILDTNLTTVPDSLVSTMWEWSTKPENAVWDEFQAARLDLSDSTLVLKTGYYNTYYGGEWRPVWLVNAQYDMDPVTGEWSNVPCMKGDANRSNRVDRDDPPRILLDLLDYSRGRSCRDPSIPIEQCRVDVNSDGRLDIEDVVDVSLLAAGRPVPPSRDPVLFTHWEFLGRATLDSLSSVDQITLRLAGVDSVLGYHLCFEGPIPSAIVTASWMQSVDGQSDGCPINGAPVEIIATTDSIGTGGSLLTMAFPRNALGEFPESLLVKAGLAVGPDGVRYEWPEHTVELKTQPPPEQPPSPIVQLRQNRPNPFNPSTTIEYVLPVRLHVQLDIYDVLGRHVCRLVDKVQPTGLNRSFWNGLDGNGNHVATGVYFYRVRTELGDRVRKMALLR